MASTRPTKRKRTTQREELEAEEGNRQQYQTIQNRQHQHQSVANYSAAAARFGIATRREFSPVVVFAHGAGAPSSSDWMVKWKDMLSKALNAIEVVTFDYPYIAGGKRKGPPKVEKLVEFHSDVVKKTVSMYPGHPLILVGKSMGSRVSCMVASREDIAALAVICLGYPLKGTNGELRDKTLLELSLPVMFVQGSKDWLCPLEKLEFVRNKMTSLNELHVIEGGDHSFQISKKHLQTAGSTQEEVESLALQAIARFITSFLRAM